MNSLSSHFYNSLNLKKYILGNLHPLADIANTAKTLNQKHLNNSLLGNRKDLINTFTSYKPTHQLLVESILMGTSTKDVFLAKSFIKGQSELMSNFVSFQSLKKGLTPNIDAFTKSHKELYSGISNIIQAYTPKLNNINSLNSVLNQFIKQNTFENNESEDFEELEYYQEIHQIFSNETITLPQNRTASLEDLLESEKRILEGVTNIVSNISSPTVKSKVWNYVLILITFIGLRGDYITITDKTNQQQTTELHEEHNNIIKHINDKVDSLGNAIIHVPEIIYNKRFNYRDVHLRLSPSGKILSVIKAGTLIEEIEIIGEWLFIKYTDLDTNEEMKGFAAKKYFKRIKN